MEVEKTRSVIDCQVLRSENIALRATQRAEKNSIKMRARSCLSSIQLIRKEHTYLRSCARSVLTHGFLLLNKDISSLVIRFNEHELCVRREFQRLETALRDSDKKYWSVVNELATEKQTLRTKKHELIQAQIGTLQKDARLRVEARIADYRKRLLQSPSTAMTEPAQLVRPAPLAEIAGVRENVPRWLLDFDNTKTLYESVVFQRHAKQVKRQR
jgi:hypothetical protein